MADYSPFTKDDRLFVACDNILEFVIRDKVGGEGDPVDVTGMSFEFIVRKSEDSDSDTIRKTTDESPGGIDILPDSDDIGKIRVSIDTSDTDSIESGTYQYTLKRVDVDNVLVVSFGEIVFSQPSSH